VVTPLQSEKNTLDGTSIAKAFTTANVSAGTKIIVFASGGGTAISATCTVKDGNNNVFTEIGHSFQTNARIYMFALDSSGDGSHTSMVGTKPTITATWTATAGLGLVIQEVPGLLAGNTTAMVDGTPGTLTGTAASTGSVSFSSTATGEYTVAAMGDFGSGVTPAAVAGWTLEANSVRGSASSNCVVEYRDSVNGAEADGFTSADTNGWAIVEAAFKLASTTVTPPPPYTGGQTYRRKKARQRQHLYAPPDIQTNGSTATPEPVVVAPPTPSQWFQGSTPSISRSSLQDVVVAGSTPEPVVQAVPNVFQWYQSSQAFQSRSAFQDVPAAVQPNVTDTPNDSRWFATPKTIVSSAPPPPQAPAEPLVVTSQPASVWLETNTTQTFRSSLQDVVVTPTATPQPVVETSQPDSRYFKSGTTQVIQSPQPPAVVTSGPITYPIVVTEQPDSSYYRTQAPQDFRSSTQDTPVATPDPVVINAPTPQALLRPNLPQVLRNSAAPVIPATSTPRPVVVGLTGIPVGRGGRHVFVRPSIIVGGVAVRPPLHLGGTATDANHLGGTVTGNRFGGTVTGNRFGGTVTGNRFGGTTVVVHTLGGSSTVQRTFGGSATVVDPWGGTLDEWTMQEIDINLGEFNDETLAVAITNNGVAYDLTGKTLQALFKTAAGVLDTDPSTITLTSPSGGIVVTNAVGGLANIAIPKADLQNAGITFWRCDVVGGGLQNTAIFGKVAVTLL